MAMLSFDTVRILGLSLPDVVDGAAYGFPALKLGGKLLACIPANKSAEANSIVVRIDFEQRAELLREYSETDYVTDHYASVTRRSVRESSTAVDPLPAVGEYGPYGQQRHYGVRRSRGIEIGAPLISGNVAIVENRHEANRKELSRLNCGPYPDGLLSTGPVGKDAN